MSHRVNKYKILPWRHSWRSGSSRKCHCVRQVNSRAVNFGKMNRANRRISATSGTYWGVASTVHSRHGPFCVARYFLALKRGKNDLQPPIESSNLTNLEMLPLRFRIFSSWFEAAAFSEAVIIISLLLVPLLPKQFRPKVEAYLLCSA